VTNQEATALVLRVFDAWPNPDPSAATVGVWVERFEQYRYPGAMKEAIDALIDSSHYRPSLSDVRDSYARHVEPYKPKGLPEPELTEEERETTRRRVREFTNRLSRKFELEQEEARAAGLARTEALIREATARKEDPAWRDDSTWKLVHHDQRLLPKRKLVDKPPKDAELAGDGLWASIFKDRKAAATWRRSPSAVNAP
jgi:hypothetical protein